MRKTMMRWVCLFFLTLTLQAQCAENYETGEIRVHLATSSPLSPVYVGKIASSNAFLDSSYLQQLEDILLYDLRYSGHISLMDRGEEKEKILSHKETKSAFSAERWKSHGVAHVIQPKFSEKKLSVMVFSVQTGSLKQFSEIEFTGHLTEDRRSLHKLSDAIVKALFNVDGVASCHVLYSAQQKQNAQGAQWTSEIWECDSDGFNARQITREGSYCVTPVFLPARNDRFLYVSYKLGQPKIYIASLKEGVGHRLVDIRGNQLLPAISPQRDKIAFICDAAGRSDLFIQPFHPEKGESGKPVQLFSYPRSTQASPTFSPDGSKLAFVSDKDGSPRIYIISTQVSSKRNDPIMITKQNSESSCPSWSPDGTKLAYSAKTKGTRQIWIYDFEKRQEEQLTYGPGNKENPAWAPDSLHLVFNSTDANSCELYLVNLNQPEAVKISRGQGKKHYPTWAKR